MSCLVDTKRMIFDIQRPSQYPSAFSRIDKFKGRVSSVDGEQSKTSFSETFRRKCLWIGLYLMFNLLLTIHNKSTMTAYPFPYAVTALHTFFNTLAVATLWLNETYHPLRLHASEAIGVMSFAIPYSCYIALSNTSLEFVTLPIYQVLRSLNPILVVMISFAFFSKTFARQVYVALGFIMFGVFLTTVGGEYSVFGVVVTLAGTFLAASKTVMMAVFLESPSALSPLDLLFYISPVACLMMCTASIWTGEAEQIVYTLKSAESSTHAIILDLATNGCIAVGLNIVSFTANKYTGALAISVAESIRQVLFICLAHLYFGYDLNPINGVGLVTTVLGGVYYATLDGAANKDKGDVQSPSGSPLADEIGELVTTDPGGAQSPV